jgi:hypothetical protein
VRFSLEVRYQFSHPYKEVGKLMGLCISVFLCSDNGRETVPNCVAASVPRIVCLSLVKKGKVVPLRSIEAHLGDRRYSSYSFLTSALEGGEWSESRSGRSLPPGKEPPVPIVQEAGWAPEPVWTQRLEEKSSASVRNRTSAVQSVDRHYTD